MEYIVDVQGFKRPLNAFTFKEIAITALVEDAVPSVYLFEPPYQWTSLPVNFQCQNSWLTRNYHGMAWEVGEIPYADVQEVMQRQLRNASKVYVKGLEKKKWVGNLVPNVCNLEDLGCPSLRNLGSRKKWCTHHTICDKPVCAAYNVEILKEWFLNRNVSLDVVD